MTHLLKTSSVLLSLSLLALVSTANAQNKKKPVPPIDTTASPKPKFADVPADHWASGATGYMLQQGIMEGNAHDLFRGNDPLNRYEFAVSMARLISMHTPPPVPPPYGMVTRDDLNEVLERLTKIEKRLDALEQTANTAPATASTPGHPTELKDLRQEVSGLSQQLANSINRSSTQK